MIESKPIISAELVEVTRKKWGGEEVEELHWKCRYLINTPDEEIERLNALYPVVEEE